MIVDISCPAEQRVPHGLNTLLRRYETSPSVPLSLTERNFPSRAQARTHRLHTHERK